jgi:hypothetical protein
MNTTVAIMIIKKRRFKQRSDDDMGQTIHVYSPNLMNFITILTIENSPN